jgi:hypothetical protein
MQHSTNILHLRAQEDKGTKLHKDAGMVTFSFILLLFSKSFMPIPVAAWVYDRSLIGLVGSNPAYGMDVCLL